MFVCLYIYTYIMCIYVCMYMYVYIYIYIYIEFFFLAAGLAYCSSRVSVCLHVYMYISWFWTMYRIIYFIILYPRVLFLSVCIYIHIHYVHTRSFLLLNLLCYIYIYIHMQKNYCSHSGNYWSPLNVTVTAFWGFRNRMCSSGPFFLPSVSVRVLGEKISGRLRTE